MISLLASFLITLGALMLALKGLKMLHRRTSQGDLPIAIIQQVPTGRRHSIALVKVGDRMLLLGMGEASLQLLAEVDPKEIPAAVASPASFPGPKPGWTRWGGLVGRLLTTLILVSLPLAADAQEVTAPPPSRAATSAPQPTVPTVQGPEAPQIEFAMGRGSDELKLNGTVGLVVFLGTLTILPAVVMMATSFTRIVIVLHFLRSAMGTPTTPPTQLLVAMAVMLSGVVMQPVLTEVNQNALQPYLAGQISQATAFQTGIVPLRRFMLANTRDSDLGTFVELSNSSEAATLAEVPTMTVMSAFVTSELRTAFQMGFVLYLPFVVVDLIVASVLMSMGMFMLPPQMVSLPFKLLLFVLADGWTLIVRNLITSFQA